MFYIYFTFFRYSRFQQRKVTYNRAYALSIHLEVLSRFHYNPEALL